MSIPNFSYTLASTNPSPSSQPTPVLTNPLISSSGPTGTGVYTLDLTTSLPNPSPPTGKKWYYYLIKNDGHVNTLSNINLDPNFNWFMYLIAPGGAGGSVPTGVKSAAGGGGGGQILNVILNNDAGQSAISSLVLNPIGLDTHIMTTFTTNTSFTTTNTIPATTFKGLNNNNPTTYYLYCGIQGGGAGSFSGQYATGGSGGSANSTPVQDGTVIAFGSYQDPGCIGATGGGATATFGPSMGNTYNGYAYWNSTGKKYGTNGSVIKFPLSDGSIVSVAGGNSGYFTNNNNNYVQAGSGNLSQVMFYCYSK
jgi:hypothetical protein